MATCTSCNQPLGDDDRFCTLCGKAAATPPPGGPPPLTSSGAAPAGTAPGFRWKWALLTIPIAVGTSLGLLVIAGFTMSAIGWSDDTASDGAKLAVGGTWILGSMLLSGLVVGLLSPGRTVLEPAFGLAVAVVALNVLGGDVEGAVGSWVLPFGIGAAGAWLGEWLQGRLKSR